MSDEKLEKRTIELIKNSRENNIEPLTYACFFNDGCDITKCRSNDYNHKENIGKCCPYYKDICKIKLDALFRDVYESSPSHLSH